MPRSRAIARRGPPPHIGIRIREECLETYGLNVQSTADLLGVKRPTLSRLLTGKSGLSAPMAIRLEQVFGLHTASEWLALQSEYDLYLARISCAIDRDPVFPARSKSRRAV